MVGPTKVNSTVSTITGSGSDFVNVLSIAGVIGDGVTDCTAALQAAITALPGAAYYFPPGTYLIKTATLSLGTNCRLFGAGSLLSILKNTDFATFGGPLIDTTTASGVELRDLGFNWTGSVAAPGAGSATNLCLKIRSASKFKMENCRVTITNRVSAAVGIQSWFAPKSGAAALQDYVLTRNTITAKDTLLDVNSIAADGYIQDNNFNFSAAGASYAVALALCNNITLEGNTAQGVILGTGCSNVSILNNSVVISQNPAVAQIGAIALSNEAATEPTNCSIIGNFVNAGNNANLVTGVISSDRVAGTGHIIANNYITAAGHAIHGIHLRNRNTLVQGNQIIGDMNNGINLGTNNNDNQGSSILSNIIKGVWGRGISFNNNSSQSAVTGNVILDCNQQNIATNGGAAIYLNDGADSTVTYNHIRAPGGTKPAYGVYISAGALATTTMVLGNNTGLAAGIGGAQTANYSIGASATASNI